MRILAVTEPGTRVARDGEILVLSRAGEVSHRARLQDLSQLVLIGSVELTHGAVAALLDRGIDVVWLTGRGRYRGRLVGPLSGNVALRSAQYARLQASDFGLSFARSIVAGKVQNQRNLMLRAQRSIKDLDLASAIGGLRRVVDDLPAVADLDALRGLEGRAAALYFGSLGRLLRNPGFRFTRRVRRPPTDPVNACLSFGYSVLLVEMESQVYRAGLDPMAGFLHAPAHGRPSLVLDLIEEFRPLIVDSLVLRLVNRRQLSPADFGDPAEEDERDPFAGEPGPVPPTDPQASQEARSPAETVETTTRDSGTTAARNGDDGTTAARTGEAMTDEGSTPSAETPPIPVYLRGTGRRVFLGALYGRLRDRLHYPPRRGSYSLRDILLEQIYHAARVIQGEDIEYHPFVPR
ncbi:MAG: CRISPR-associated endonuclease Cas1 [Planctomycetes bacterium]|nr:CRISPR-associated endonuclease Cas1 [Planctomycetota bacterium]